MGDIPCNQCGVCCIIANCGLWDGGENEICSALTFHEEGYTSCKYIETKGRNPYPGGCTIKRYTELFVMFKEQAEEKIGKRLVGTLT